MKKRMQGVKWKRYWIRANNGPYIREKRKNPLMKEQFLEFSKAPSVPHKLRDDRVPQKVDLAYHMNLQQGDLVQVMLPSCRGPFLEDKVAYALGKQGVVRRVMRKQNLVLVHGMNMKKRFRVNTPVGETMVTTELPIHITNVAPVDPILKKPTRSVFLIRYTMDGECVRISKVSGCAIPDPVPIVREDREELSKRAATQMAVRKRFRGVQNAIVDRRHYQMLARMALGC
eukprot:g5732.t1